MPLVAGITLGVIVAVAVAVVDTEFVTAGASVDPPYEIAGVFAPATTSPVVITGFPITDIAVLGRMQDGIDVTCVTYSLDKLYPAVFVAESDDPPSALTPTCNCVFAERL